MAETVTHKIHTIEWRRKDQLSGRWGRWHVMCRNFFSHRDAKRERDVRREDERDYQNRIVTFNRGRTYEAA